MNRAEQKIDKERLKLFTPEEMTESNLRVISVEEETEKRLYNAIANVELEGLICTKTEKEELRKLIQGEISIEKYTAEVLSDY